MLVEMEILLRPSFLCRSSLDRWPQTGHRTPEMRHVRSEGRLTGVLPGAAGWSDSQFLASWCGLSRDQRRRFRGRRYLTLKRGIALRWLRAPLMLDHGH